MLATLRLSSLVTVVSEVKTGDNNEQERLPSNWSKMAASVMKLEAGMSDLWGTFHLRDSAIFGIRTTNLRNFDRSYRSGSK